MSVAQFGAVIGLMIGIINGIILALNIASSSAITTGGVLGVGSGIMTFALNVIMGIFFGFLGGAIIALIYNFGLGETGGKEWNLKPGYNCFTPIYANALAPLQCVQDETNQTRRLTISDSHLIHGVLFSQEKESARERTVFNNKINTRRSV